MKSEKTKSARRGFLLGAGTAGIAGAAVVATGGIGGEQVAAAKPDTKGRGGGYHVSDHVRNYYRTTKV